MRRVAWTFAAWLGAGTTACVPPAPTLQTQVPSMAAAQACTVQATDPYAASLVAASPPRLEGDVELVSLRGDDRLRLAGRSRTIWSADGQHLISATGEVLIVWDAFTGEAQHTVPLGKEGAAVALAESPDGQTIALVTQENLGNGGALRSQLVLVRPLERTVRLLDRAGPGELRFSDDGARLIGGAYLWDVASGKRLHGMASFSGAEYRTLQDVLSPRASNDAGGARAYAQWFDDGRSGVEVRHDGDTLTLERWRDGRVMAVARLAETFPRGVPSAERSHYALSPNGAFFVTADKGQARRWSLQDGTELRFTAPADLGALVLSNNGEWLAHWQWPRIYTRPPPRPLPPYDQQVHLWSLRDGAERWAQDHDGGRLVFSRDDVLLMHGRGRLSHQAYDVASGQTLKRDEDFVALHAPSRRALVARVDQPPAVVALNGSDTWPKRTREAEEVIDRATTGARVTLDRHGRYRMRSVAGCFRLPSLLPRYRDPYPVRFSDDGSRLVGIGRQGRGGSSVIAWETASGRLLGGVGLDIYRPYVKVLTATSEVVVEQDGHLLMVDPLRPSAPTMRSVWAPGDTFLPRWAPSSRDGRYLPKPRADGRQKFLDLIDTRNGDDIELYQHDGLKAFTLSPDDRYVAAVGRGRLRWWRLPDERAIRGPGFASKITRLQFNNDASLLAVVTDTGSVFLVDIARRKTVGRVDLRVRYDRARLVTWTGPRQLTIDTVRGAEVVVRGRARPGPAAPAAFAPSSLANGVTLRP